MPFFVTVDPQNNITGLFSDEPDYATPPANSVSITDAEGETLRNGFAGYMLANGAVVINSAATLESARNTQRAIIRTAYESAANALVVVNGINWQGGFDSALKLDAAKRLAEAAGLATVTFYDASNVGHDLSFADALNIIIQVSSAFQQALAKKQACMVAIANAADGPTVQAVTW